MWSLYKKVEVGSSETADAALLALMMEGGPQNRGMLAPLNKKRQDEIFFISRRILPFLISRTCKFRTTRKIIDFYIFDKRRLCFQDI